LIFWFFVAYVGRAEWRLRRPPIRSRYNKNQKKERKKATSEALFDFFGIFVVYLGRERD
jgi:hypothetical protein